MADEKDRSSRWRFISCAAAVDACGASMFACAPHDVGFIHHAQEAGLGRSDWEPLVMIDTHL